MTASSDSSPVSPLPPAQTSVAQPGSPASDGRVARSPRKWLGLLALLLLVAGVGFALWKARSGGEQGMQGQPAVPVEVERLQEDSLEDSSEYVGTLDSQAGVSLQPEADGRVTQIFVSSGDSVAAGDPIMQLSPQRSQADYNAALASVSAARSARDTARAQLRAAQEQQAQQRADLELQQSDYARTATLVEKGALPQEQLDQVVRDRTVAQASLNSARQEISALEASLEQAEATLVQANANADATQQDLLDKTVTAPVAGIVGDIEIDLGDYVTAGDQLVTITQNQNLDLEIAVPIDESDRLRTGLPVELMLFGSDEVIATGTLNFVSPTTDASTQTILAKARFSTPGRPLQDDQRLEVRVIWDKRPGILIPTTAISRLGGETFVFVPGEPDPPAAGEGPPQAAPQAAPPAGEGEGPPPVVARLKPVELGSLQGNEYQVLEGLNPGDTVITSGLLNLRDGVPIDTQAGSGQPGGETDER
ncbi:MAG: efflux RND transporter periplasmic adaptor subunit [Phormidesmis sp.]